MSDGVREHLTSSAPLPFLRFLSPLFLCCFQVCWYRVAAVSLLFPLPQVFPFYNSSTIASFPYCEDVGNRRRTPLRHHLLPDLPHFHPDKEPPSLSR